VALSTHRRVRRGDKQELISEWDHFWFANCPTPALDLVRIFFGLTVLQFLTGLWGLYRLKDLSPRFPRSPVFESALLYRGVPMPYPGLSWLPKIAPNLQFHLELMLLILAVCMTIGLASRYVIPLLSIGFSYLFFQTQWNYHHHSFLVVLVLAVLSFATCGKHFGVDAALARKKPASQSVFPLRLIQVLVIILYGFTFLSKLRRGWVDGSAISLLAEGGRTFGAPGSGSGRPSSNGSGDRCRGGTRFCRTYEASLSPVRDRARSHPSSIGRCRHGCRYFQLRNDCPLLQLLWIRQWRRKQRFGRVK